MNLICAFCNTEFLAASTQYRAKRVFCSKDHYDKWRFEQSNIAPGEANRSYLAYKRQVWGGSGKTFKEVGAWARHFGRQFEVMARDRFLPELGFTDIHDCCGKCNIFFVDFIATYQGQRVLVDVTAKMDARAESKIPMARSLGMRLFYLHVPPAHPELYHFHEVDAVNRTTVKVPLRHIHDMYRRLGETFRKPAGDRIYNRAITAIAKVCDLCGKGMMVTPSKKHRRYCSKACSQKVNLEKATKAWVETCARRRAAAEGE